MEKKTSKTSSKARRWFGVRGLKPTLRKTSESTLKPVGAGALGAAVPAATEVPPTLPDASDRDDASVSSPAVARPRPDM